MYSIILISFSISSYSQFEEEIKESLTYKPKLTFRYDSRNSIISNRGARINSFKTGLEYNNILTFGVGYDWLSSDIKRNKFLIENDHIVDTIDMFLKLKYISLYTEYKFYRDKKWEFYLPVSFGIGTAYYRYYYNTSYINEKYTLALIYETNMIGQYKIIPYLAVGAGVGYRIMIKGNSMTNENFTSSVYIVKIKLLFSQIISDLSK
ncbi:MAG: hypothetical protein ABIJ97_00220 [Bacteroidota bacterium]